MLVELLYILGPEDREPKRLAEVELSFQPNLGANITWGERVFKVLEASWRMEVVHQGEVTSHVLKLSLLLGHIAGPKPIILAPALTVV